MPIEISNKKMFTFKHIQYQTFKHIYLSNEQFQRFSLNLNYC